VSISRRRFLRTAAAGAGALVLPPAANATTVPGELVAGVFRHAVREDGPPTAVWGFNLQVPGPVLRFRQGDEAVLQLRNGLPQPSTVHWHGIRLPNAMDGVPSVTQLAVAPDSEFTYRFTLPDAGTYWYHPHQSSFEQVPRGLYGALVVEEADPLPVDRDELWVLTLTRGKTVRLRGSHFHGAHRPTCNHAAGGGRSAGLPHCVRCLVNLRTQCAASRPEPVSAWTPVRRERLRPCVAGGQARLSHQRARRVRLPVVTMRLRAVQRWPSLRGAVRGGVGGASLAKHAITAVASHEMFNGWGCGIPAPRVSGGHGTHGHE